MLLAYGRSLHRAGDSATAIPILVRVKADAPLGSIMATAAADLLEEALATGAKPRVVEHREDEIPQVSPEDVRSALDDFKRFLSGDVRMRFWKDGKWIPSPEGLAEVLLQGFIRARFGSRALPLTQVRAGAGIIDLYAQFQGGLAVVIELKMCGAGYSSNYAASGMDQLHHYMEHHSNYGFLVVLDGRLETNGESLALDDAPSSHTIREVLIDMSPRISKRRRSTKNRA